MNRDGTFCCGENTAKGDITQYCCKLGIGIHCVRDVDPLRILVT